MHSAFTIVATALIMFYRIATNALETPVPLINECNCVLLVDIFWGLLIAQMVFEIITYMGVFRSCGVQPGNPGKLLSTEFVYNKPKEKTEDCTYGLETEEPWNSDEVKLNLARSISHIALNDMMLIIALLMRPHNVIMIPSVYVTCKLTSKCLDHKLLDVRVGRNTDVLDVLSETLAHVWIGYLFFFYQVR